MKIERFEDIIAWQESRKLVKQTYNFVNRSKAFSQDFKLTSQITSSAVSIMSNIAEGFSRKSHKEFIRFLFISKGSLSEFQSQLYVARDLNYIGQPEFDICYEQADKTAKMISKFITYLKSLTQ